MKVEVAANESFLRFPRTISLSAYLLFFLPFLETKSWLLYCIKKLKDLVIQRDVHDSMFQ